MNSLSYEATEAQDAGRRYRGRSTARPASVPNRLPEPRPNSGITPVQSLQPAKKLVEGRIASTAWSMRLSLMLLGLILLTIAVRISVGFGPPVDAPLGVEATNAAFVRQISGMIVPIETADTPFPWRGNAPVDPLSTLPVYSWLAAAVAGLTGIEAAGRAISLLFSVAAGVTLFAIVHRTAGARAAVYSSLLFIVAPLSILFGHHYSPAALLLLAQAAVILLLVRWRATSTPARPAGSMPALIIALFAAFSYGLVDPAAFLLGGPALVLFIRPTVDRPALAQAGRRIGSARDTIARSLDRGRFYLYGGILVLGAVAWQVYKTGTRGDLVVGPSDGFNPGSLVSSLVSAATYLQVIGGLVGQVTGMIGLLLLGAGLLAGARGHYRYLFHAWLAAGFIHVLLDSGRLGRHEDVFMPLLLPACALVGIGAAWSASFPARVWLAITERNRSTDEEYAVSPHTAWLLDVPEQSITPDEASRPQAKLALGKNLADRSRSAGRRAKRASLVLGGHAAVAACFALLLITNWDDVSARSKLTTESQVALVAGQDLGVVTPPGSSIIIAGTSAPELFFASGRTGWALSTDELTLSEVQRLQRAGSGYMLSTDQDALGRHPDYMGFLANFSVARLTRDYILFDLNRKPATSDRLYFLESGHTLGGEFRRFWETRGGVERLGFPISEEYQEVNPLDGQTRTVQYFERAILELHPEKQGTSDVVMIAPAGRWVTRGREFPRIQPFTSTGDNAYFAETGHSLKQAFLRFWLREGGLAQFGYPISEELPEISSSDGKVYTVQYFERARLEWHTTEAGTPREVQLGLIGKQALEMRK